MSMSRMIVGVQEGKSFSNPINLESEGTLSENKIEIKQINSLYGPIQIKRIIPDGGLAQLPIENLEVSTDSSSVA